VTCFETVTNRFDRVKSVHELTTTPAVSSCLPTVATGIHIAAPKSTLLLQMSRTSYMPSPRISTYRPDIDGLRAVAVIPVVLYHIGFAAIGGGFVGVDVFFVISGYLIASVLIKEIEAKRFSVITFYERRIRRILPAFTAMTLLSVPIAIWLLFPQDLKAFGTSLWSATLFVSNIAFWIESGDYFDIGSSVKPLLHTWSLAVEEQFYIFFPLALAILFKLSRPRQAFACCLVVFAVSLALSIYGQQQRPLANFYLLPTRAWEILGGSLLAFGRIPHPRSRRQAQLEGILGLMCILAPVVTYQSTTPFPGLAAVPPVLGAALIIHSGIGADQTIIRRLLSWTPLRFVGLISYSLYLWHWPIIVFTGYVLLQPSLWTMIGLLAGSLVVATLSWRFVERPFRGRNKILGPPRLFMITGITLVSIALCGWLLQWTDGMPRRFPHEIVSMADKTTYQGRWRECGGAYAKRRTQQTLCALGSADARPTFLIIGDSHAEAVAAAIFEAAGEVGRAGYQITDTGYRPFIGFRKYGEVPKYQYLNALTIAFLDDHPEIQNVIVALYWRQAVLVDSYLDETGHRVSGKIAAQEGLEALVARYPDRRFLVIASPANSPLFGGAVAARAAWFRRDFHPWVTRQDFGTLQAKYTDILEGLRRNPQVTVLHLSYRLCDARSCSGLLDDGRLAYSDDNHLSYAASKLFDEDFARFLQHD
jgi:peptidoglycan/LPS O-acetylase OafA/YrhL